LANLIIEKSDSTDIRFLPPDIRNFTENNLELYPSLHGYSIARNLYEEIFESYNQQFSEPFLCFADLAPEIVHTAESLLIKYGVSVNSKYVGIHVRENQSPSRANRNSKFDSIIPALEYVESLGYITVRLGLKNKRELSSFPMKLKGVDFTNKTLTQYQQDCLQLYIWSKSEFFIGNLSGGTFPPSLFGIPTIYFDVFPLKHFIPPSKMDIVLPKRLYNLATEEVLPLKQVFSPEFNFLQIENAIRLQANGFGLKSTTSNEMIAAINELISRKSGATMYKEISQSILDFEMSIRAAQLQRRMPFDY
jgi:putative glycosyltransferase (TIGR04372 family)